MSFVMMAKAMKIKTGNPTRKLILLKLADNANDDGECYPSYQHIAEQCEVSRKTVMVHVDALIKMGLVKKKERKTKQGNRRSNLYIITLGGGVKSTLGGSVKSTPGGVKSTPGGGVKITPITYHSLNLSHNQRGDGAHGHMKKTTNNDFDQFWKSYPKIVGKQAAIRSWEKTNKNRPELDFILMALEQQKKSKQWAKDGGQYIPNPATWLSQGRWDDEAPEVQDNANCGNVYY